MSSTPSIVQVKTFQENFDSARVFLLANWCVLLQGQSSAGKTLLATELARRHNNDNGITIKTINVDDTFDSKDLLGKFSATDVPGVFEWVAGPITSAVRDGTWVLMEDVDLASFDVFSVLLPLITTGKLFLADKGITLDAHPQFRLIATQQVSEIGGGWNNNIKMRDISEGGEGDREVKLLTSTYVGSVSDLQRNSRILTTKKANSIPNPEAWPTVQVHPPTADEKLVIVKQQYPNVPDSVLKALLYNVPHCYSGLRDMLKWARRVALLLKNSNNNTNQQALFLSSRTREMLFAEAYDCFGANSPRSSAAAQRLITVLAQCSEVPLQVANTLLEQHKPQMIRTREDFIVGRASLSIVTGAVATVRSNVVAFAETKAAMTLLERIACAVRMNEPVLLTGETGVGKTFLVQYLADNIGQNLIVHNLNQQTDSSDFMGGWKPRDLSQPIRGLHNQFLDLFRATFDDVKNAAFLQSIVDGIAVRQWDVALIQFEKGVQSAITKLSISCDVNHNNANTKTTTTAIMTTQTKNTDEQQKMVLLQRWNTFSAKLSELQDLVQTAKTSFMFVFEEGTLVRAWREGYWILLDEVNLATTEVLERVASVLGGIDELIITEKGGSEVVKRHPNFRVFANMNPPTDVGKKDLPPALRYRFTEFYVPDPFDEHDLIIVVSTYLAGLSADAKVNEIVKFFLTCVNNVRSTLCDLNGENRPPHFSLRSLTRALTYVRKATALYGFNTAVFDGLMMSFASPLQRKFHDVIERMIITTIFKGQSPAKATLPKQPPGGDPKKRYIAYEHIWLEMGPEAAVTNEHFILTASVRQHLKNISRAIFIKRPVLLEGPTSAGKSSMVKFLAEVTGHKFVRINNHESTEIQEYLGHYVSDDDGRLRFVDGVLTSAVRHGHWVVLDELNLAPTEVLEALNRLLDDNCELFIPDTHETISPHPSLRIFATQNPSGAYGGRKTLSRAFRNRFLEIIVDDIPVKEITEILCKRYSMAPQFADKMIAVMQSLQLSRASSQVFAGRYGFITPRDLFRWADRKVMDIESLAKHGYLLLGERCRRPDERQRVRDVIEKETRVTLDPKTLYDPVSWPFVAHYYTMVTEMAKDRIVWTESMQRLFTIVGLCLEHKEPVLLVGETGSSKTTICQIWATVLQQQLHIINCHQHSEAADFLGSLRPTPPTSVTKEEGLFAWQDGPLVRAMRNGDIFVLDEISLAEDSVLERLNSVLETSRTLTLAEKSTGETLEAVESFRFLATMNPGGDFGKKELSLALRNRFTEIWVTPITAQTEISQILEKRLPQSLWNYADKMAKLLVSVAEQRRLDSGGAVDNNNSSGGNVLHISIRDVVGWADFMTATNCRCDGDVAFWHGLDAVLLDGLSVGAGLSENAVQATRATCLAIAAKLIPETPSSCLTTPFWELCSGVNEPVMPAGQQRSFHFAAPTTRQNCSKLLRASIMKKAIMLEGSPGVGKTSIVEALGRALGRYTVRINLSEQTDMMDLLGAFLPRASNGNNKNNKQQQENTTEIEMVNAVNDDAVDSVGPCFEWSDGILLSAVKAGHWVILDELNLASQPVLEGLNALLDHRGTVYLPELCQEISAHPEFRIFACQNPLIEGGGRKGLPKSFLNRFTKVRVAAFTFTDLITIAEACTSIDKEVLHRMVRFVVALQRATMEERQFGVRGAPWEFNLRDVLRWSKMMIAHNSPCNPHPFSSGLFFQRFRTDKDRASAMELYRSIMLTSDNNNIDCRFLTELPIDFLFDADGNLCASENCVVPADYYKTIDNDTIITTNPFIIDRSLPYILPSSTPHLETILRCAVHNQFCVLVGPASSGKSALLELAAGMMKVSLEKFAMTAGCDTVDLLGGFDQVEGQQGHFAWRDSVIVRAMERGSWVVLDNSNFCSASVLDRLNSLVEPNGMLVINEQGLVDGAVRVVRPHPSFRLFATIDPKYGEMSRALRNRAVEVYLQPYSIPSQEVLTMCAGVTREDASSTPLSTYVPIALIEKVLQFHRIFMIVSAHVDTAAPGQAQLADATASGAPNLTTLLRTLNTIGAQMVQQRQNNSNNNHSENNNNIYSAARIAVLNCYMRNRSGSWVVHKDTMQRVLDTLFGEVDATTFVAKNIELVEKLQQEEIIMGLSDGLNVSDNHNNNLLAACGLTHEMLMDAAALSVNQPLSVSLDTRSAHRSLLLLKKMINNILVSSSTTTTDASWDGALFSFLIDSAVARNNNIVTPQRRLARISALQVLSQQCCGSNAITASHSYHYIISRLFVDTVYNFLRESNFHYNHTANSSSNLLTNATNTTITSLVLNSVLQILVRLEATVGRTARDLNFSNYIGGVSASLCDALKTLSSAIVVLVTNVVAPYNHYYDDNQQTTIPNLCEAFSLMLFARPVFEFFNNITNNNNNNSDGSFTLDGALPILASLSLLYATAIKGGAAFAPLLRPINETAAVLKRTVNIVSDLSPSPALLRFGGTPPIKSKSERSLNNAAATAAEEYRAAQPLSVRILEPVWAQAAARHEIALLATMNGALVSNTSAVDCEASTTNNTLSTLSAAVPPISSTVIAAISEAVTAFINAFVHSSPLLTEMEITSLQVAAATFASPTVTVKSVASTITTAITTSSSSSSKKTNEKNLSVVMIPNTLQYCAATIPEVICSSARFYDYGAGLGAVPGQWAISACRALRFSNAVTVKHITDLKNSDPMHTMDLLRRTLNSNNENSCMNNNNTTAILTPQNTATIMRKWLMNDLVWMSRVVGNIGNISTTVGEDTNVAASIAQHQQQYVSEDVNHHNIITTLLSQITCNVVETLPAAFPAARRSALVAELADLLCHDDRDVLPTCLVGVLLHALRCLMLTPTSLIDPMLRQYIKKSLNEGEAQYWGTLAEQFAESEALVNGYCEELTTTDLYDRDELLLDAPHFIIENNAKKDNKPPLQHNYNFNDYAQLLCSNQRELKQQSTNYSITVAAAEYLRHEATMHARRAAVKYAPRPDATGHRFVEMITFERDVCAGVLSDARLDTLRALVYHILGRAAGGAPEKKARKEDNTSSQQQYHHYYRMIQREELESWIELLKKSVTEMRKRFAGYEDFVLPFCQSLLSVVFFLEVILVTIVSGMSTNNSALFDDALSSFKTTTSSSGTLISSTDATALLSFPSPLGTLSMGTTLHRLDITDNFADLVKLMDARLIEMTVSTAPVRLMDEQSANNNTTHIMAEQLFSQYATVFLAVEEMERDAVRQDQLSVMYKEKAIIIEGDDEKATRRLREMFPEYIREFVQDIDGENGNDDNNVMSDNNKQNSLWDDLSALDAAYDATETGVDAGTDEVDAAQLRAGLGRRAKVIFSGDNGSRIRAIAAAHMTLFKSLNTLSVIKNNTNTCNNIHHMVDDASIMNISSSSRSTDEYRRLEAFCKRFDAVASMQRKSAYNISCSVHDEYRLIGGFQARLKLQEKEIFSQGGQTSVRKSNEVTTYTKIHTPAAYSIDDKVNTAFNIYLDPEPSEAARIGKCLADLLVTVLRLRKEYPENPTLIKIEKIAKRLQAYPVLNTPLMRIMTGTEVLLGQCYEWQRNASIEVSFIDHINAISSYVLRWRRLELHCWPHIFTAKQEEFSTRASLTWFDLHRYTRDIINRSWSIASDGNNNNTFDILECFAYVNDYMWRSSLGEFTTRLAILEGFGHQLTLCGKKTGDTHNAEAVAAGSLFLHTAGFFEQYRPLLAEACRKLIAPLEGDLQEFCQIMRWEDANYHAVRATTQKSHMKIARILGQMDDGLRIGIIHIISNSEGALSQEASLGLPIPFVQLGPKEKKKIAEETAKKKAALMTKREKKAMELAAKKAKAVQSSKQMQKEKKRSRNDVRDEALEIKLTREITEIDSAVKEIEAADDPLTSAELLANVHKQYWSSQRILEGCEFMESSADDIVTRIIQLQLPKVTMAQKMRAFKMFLEMLDEAGVPQTHEGRVYSWEVLFSDNNDGEKKRTIIPPLLTAGPVLIEAFPSVMIEHPNEDAQNNKNKKAKKLVAGCVGADVDSETISPHQEFRAQFSHNMYKLIRALSIMRDAERSPHSDLSMGQVKKGTGMAESLFAAVTKSTSNTVELAELKNLLKILRAAVNSAASTVENINNNSNIFAANSISIPLRESAVFIHHLMKSCVACSTLAEQALWLGGISSSSGNTEDKDNSIVSTTTNVITTAHQHLHRISSQLFDFCSSHYLRQTFQHGYLLTVSEVVSLLEKLQGMRKELLTLSSCDTAAGKAAADLLPELRAVLDYTFTTSTTTTTATNSNNSSEITIKPSDYLRMASPRLGSSESLLPHNSQHIMITSASKSCWCSAVTRVLNTIEQPLQHITPAASSNSIDVSSPIKKADDKFHIENNKIKNDSGDEEKEEKKEEAIVKDALIEQESLLATLIDILPQLRALTADPSYNRTLPSASERMKLVAHINRLITVVDAVAYSSVRLTTATSKLCAVITKLMTALMQKGFCKPEEEEDGEGEGGEGETKEGTGMDDGKGEKDVTDQLDNEDQLMNMKDKEEQEKEGDEKDKDDGDDKDKDKAAEVETDFQADKENRSEDDEKKDDDGDEEDEGSEKEYGSIDEENEKERKKTRKEKNDTKERDKDEGGDAEEVPEDDLDDNKDEKGFNSDEEDEETKEYGNKEDQIRDNKNDDTDNNSEDKEGELIGDSDKDMNDDGSSDDDEYDELNTSRDDADGSSDDDDSAKELDSDADDDDGVDEDKRKDEEDDDRDPDREEDAELNKEGKQEEDGDDGSTTDNVEDDDKAMTVPKDRNKQYHGEQDDEVGEENINDESKDRDRNTKREDNKNIETAENEEQVGAEQQEMDEAGRSWKKREQKKDTEERPEENQRQSDDGQRHRSDQQNPLKALKDAMQRHNQRIKQLNLSKQAHIDNGDDDDGDGDNNNNSQDDDDNDRVNDEDYFEMHERGLDEGLAPTEERVPVAAEDQLDKDNVNHDDEDEEEDGNNKEETPQDRRIRRQKLQEVEDEKKKKKNEEVAVEEKTNEKKKKKLKNDKKIKFQAAAASDEEEENEQEKPVDDDKVVLSEIEKLQRGREMWYKYESIVQAQSQQLTEQLRLILEPTLADKLQGDYKTGKRINIKKIIPYIASQFKKDRIWLRRTKPNKRAYQVLVALDDSQSMKHNHCDEISCQAVMLLSKAMQQLDVGEFGILRFGKETVIAHPLAEPFGAESGPKVFADFTFEQSSTNMRGFLEMALSYMDEERIRLGGSIRSTTAQLKQLLFIISDGQLTEDRKELRRLCARAEENGQVVVLVILDVRASSAARRFDALQQQPSSTSDKYVDNNTITIMPPSDNCNNNNNMKPLSAAEQFRQARDARNKRLSQGLRGGGANTTGVSSSILDITTIEFVGNTVVRSNYMDNFPFPYYIVVQDIPSLPTLLADAMRQWFELMNNM